MNTWTRKQAVTGILKTGFTACAFFLNRECLKEKITDLSKMKDLAGLPLVTAALVAAGLWILYNLEWFAPKLRQAEEKVRLRPGYRLLAGLFAFFMVFGESYMRCHSWKLVFGNGLLLAVSFLMAVGFYLLFCRIFLLLELFWERKPAVRIEAPVRSLYERHPFWCSMGMILFCWAVYIIAFYPAILSPDPSFQIKQYFNEDTKYADYVVLVDENVKMTNHHPVAHSVLLGLSIEAGRLFGNDNLGLFFYSLIQILVLSGVLSGTLCYMKKLGISLKFRLAVLCVYCFVPMFPFYSMSAVKDVLFSAGMVLYGLMLFHLIDHRQEPMGWKQIGGLILLLFFLDIFRNNGFHVIILSLPFLFPVMKGNRKRLLIVALCFLTLHCGYYKLLLPGLHITNGSIREALSLPFQQTARYVRDHEEDVTKEDRQAIDRVLGYDTLAKRYKPELADPVKNEYNKYADSKDLKAYFAAWFRGLLKHPDTYVQATMNNVYGFFYPNQTSWYLYYKYDDRITENGLVEYHYNGLEGLRNGLVAYGNLFPYLPFVGLISNIGMNTWVLLYLAVWMFDRRRRRYFVVLLPYLASVLISVAAPANTYFRYALPYIFAMPLLMALMKAINGRRGSLENGQKDIKYEGEPS